MASIDLKEPVLLLSQVTVLKFNHNSIPVHDLYVFSIQTLLCTSRQ